MKTKYNMKKLILSAAFLVASFATVAQVGVGTTDPKGALEIKSTTSGFIMPQFANLTTIQAIRKANGSTALDSDEQGMEVYNIAEKKIYMWDGTAWVTAGSSGKFVDGTPDTTEAVYTAGNVGIGKTNPSELLDVNGNISFGTGLTSSTPTLNFNNGFGDAITASITTMALTANANVDVFLDSNANNSGETFTISTNNGANQLLQVNQVGNILGAGELTLQGDNLTVGSGSTSSTINLNFDNDFNDKIGVSSGVMDFVANASINISMDSNNNQTSEVFRIFTNNDANLLLNMDHVGNIAFSGTVSSGGTTMSVPDYVFESYYDGESAYNKEYSLIALEEIETYLKKNKHLPRMQSRKEVEKNDGKWDITRATLNNLEKIEELYLHTIEQQKQIDALQTQVKALMATKTK
jgi:hypothetical protein